MDILEFNFEETIKLLVILSSQPYKQIEAMGFGHTEEEIALDYELYFARNKDAFIEKGFITKAIAESLMEIDAFFEVRSGSNETSFWNSIATHEDWKTLRSMAKGCLKDLGMNDLDIKVNTKTEIAPRGTGPVVQTVKIELVKNST